MSMKTRVSFLCRSYHTVLLTLLSALAGMMNVPSSRAGLTVDIHTYRYPNYYVTYGWLTTNATPPAAPLGDYLISSPNGSFLRYHNDNTGLNYFDGGGTSTSDFNSYISALTNGQWSIQVTNASSTNTYFFKVTAPGLNSNLFNTATITSPLNNAQNVNNDPAFTWTGGPSGWMGTAAVNVHDPTYTVYYESATLAPSATSWNTPNPPLPIGTNIFHLAYLSNITSTVVASIPRNASSNAISGWISTASLDVNSEDVQFVVGVGNAFDAYLKGRYDFENTNNAGRDTSGNGNDSNCGSSSGPLLDVASTNAAIHSLARRFYGDTSYCFYSGSSEHASLSNALRGSFSVTAWVKTTNSINSDSANAYFGSPVLFTYSTATNGTVPLSITGSKAAFTVSNPNGTDTTIHSTTTVNDGNYHFLAVTRNQASGLMSLYVDGNLESTGSSAVQPLLTTGYIHMAGGYFQYAGLLDDLRIYSTNLSATNISVLAANNNFEIRTLATSLEATNLTWITGGNTNWYPQTTNTHDNVDAAQSGDINDNGESWIQTTVTGPGTLSFWWKVSSDEDYDYLEFNMDGNFQTDLTGESGWQQQTYAISSGSHDLRWRYYKDSSGSSGLDAGFLDQVNFTVSTNIQIALDFNVTRDTSTVGAEGFYCFPSFSSISPPPITTYEVHSPNNISSGALFSSSASALPSLGSLLNEITNGLWTIYINKNHPSERQFHFQVSSAGVTTNLLKKVTIQSPANGSTVGLVPTLSWSGATGMSYLFGSVIFTNSFVQSTNLAITATNWFLPAPLPLGTNTLYVSYGIFNATNFTFTTPVDSNSVTFFSWNTQAGLRSQASSEFVVTANGISPVQLINSQRTNSTFRFQFLSQSGKTNTVQSRTNLSLGTWVNRTNVLGDGSTKTISLPVSSAPTEFFRVSTQ